LSKVGNLTIEKERIPKDQKVMVRGIYKDVASIRMRSDLGCALYPQAVIPSCLGPIKPLNTTKVSRQGLTT
jgi:hypothetical protein